MQTSPVIVDLFCGTGGASVGYGRAGFTVRGMDKAPMPNYPYRFEQGNALRYLADLVDTIMDGQDPGVAAIHASPPCQASCTLTNGTNKQTRAEHHVNLIPVVRELLELTGLPYVIENVPGSNLRRDQVLCGEMFGLGVMRHRYFELGRWSAPAPAHKKHRGYVSGLRHGVWRTGPYFAVYGEGGGKGTVAQWREAMGIDWTWERREIAEAIPPAYTDHIGAQLMAHLRGSEVL